MLFGERQEACVAFPFFLSLAHHVTCHRCWSGGRGRIMGEGAEAPRESQ